MHPMGARQAEMADHLLKFIRENWIVIGGIVAAFWTVFQFMSNRSIPLNVSVSMSPVIGPPSTEKTTASPDADPALPITINVAVENKSAWRELAIRDPVWVAYGFRLKGPFNPMGERVPRIKPAEMPMIINHGFTSDANPKTAMTAIGDRRLIDYSYIKEPIGAGPLLGDPEIKPQETLHVQLVLPVAKGRYDYVQIRVFVPTLNQQATSGRDIKAPLSVLGPDKNYEPEVMFCLQQGQACMPMTPKQLNALGAQTHSSASEIWLGQADGS